MRQRKSEMSFKGRGAVSNASSRFERYGREPVGDDDATWDDAIREDDLPCAPSTTVVEELTIKQPEVWRFGFPLISHPGISI